MFEFVQERNEKTDYLVGGDWHGLRKARAMYEEAVSAGNRAAAERCMGRIHRLQERMGIRKTDFPELP